MFTWACKSFRHSLKSFTQARKSFKWARKVVLSEHVKTTLSERIKVLHARVKLLSAHVKVLCACVKLIIKKKICIPLGLRSFNSRRIMIKWFKCYLVFVHVELHNKEENCVDSFISKYLLILNLFVSARKVKLSGSSSNHISSCSWGLNTLQIHFFHIMFSWFFMIWLLLLTLNKPFLILLFYLVN